MQVIINLVYVNKMLDAYNILIRDTPIHQSESRGESSRSSKVQPLPRGRMIFTSTWLLTQSPILRDVTVSALTPFSDTSLPRYRSPR